MDLSSQPQDHSPTKLAAQLRHSAVREIPSARRQPIEATGAPAPRSTAVSSPAGKGFKGQEAQPLHIPREKTDSERGPESSEPLDKSGVKRGSPTDSAGLGLCPARVPLPEATSAATALLPSCFTSLAPTSANSPLWRLPPASRPATHHRQRKGKTAGAVPLPLLSRLCSHSNSSSPPLPSQLPIKGVLLPGVDSVSNTHHSFIHSFIQLASEGFLHSKELSQVLRTQGIKSS